VVVGLGVAVIDGLLLHAFTGARASSSLLVDLLV
jgi:hypothetical protein